jgi:hypothetical protein
VQRKFIRDDLVRTHCVEIVARTPHIGRSAKVLKIRAESPNRRLSQGCRPPTKDFYESVM